MDNHLRRVRKLRLESTDEDANRRGAILIEDALRTASVPDGDGSRLLVVRKLPLGTIRASDPPSAVALRIESRCRELGSLAVTASMPEAAQAPAVYFEDDVEPYIALALRLARAQDVSAWFWPIAVHGWTAAKPRDEAMRLMLAGVLSSSAGTTAALALVRALLRCGALDALASVLRHQDGQPLLEAFGWRLPSRVLIGLTADANQPGPAGAPSEVLARAVVPWFGAWGPEDARSLWLACAALAIERPALAAQSWLPRWAAEWIGASLYIANRNGHFGASSGAPASSASSTPPPALRFDDEEVPEPPFVPQPLLGEKSSGPDPREFGIAPEPERRAHRFFTWRAGLFFVIPVMERLGMAEYVAENPRLAQWSLPYLILRAIADRLQTPPDDPVLGALGELPEDPPEEVQQSVQDWMRRIRQYLRRTARIGPYSLVCRPGRLTFTETHIDVMFRLDRVDIRVRRAGLDVDPGWVPWLDRVVHFHYVGDDSYDA